MPLCNTRSDKVRPWGFAASSSSGDDVGRSDPKTERLFIPMYAATIDATEFQRGMARRVQQFPRAALLALNDSAFETRTEWRETIPRVFDRPTQLTLNAPLVRKASAARMVAEVFIRNEAFKGTAPAEYLQAQVFGGNRRRKRSEIALSRALDFPAYWVPGRSAPLDAQGNIARGQIGKILSQLRAGFDPGQNETDKRRASRLKRQRKRGGGASYFVLPVNRGKLKAGVVYERISTAFGSGVRPILIGVRRPPRYSVRYDVFSLARQIFSRRFSENFRARVRAANGGSL